MKNQKMKHKPKLAITVRNLSGKARHEVEARALAAGTSLDWTVAHLVEEALGLAASQPERPPDTIDALAGTWSTADADAFDQDLRRQRQVNPQDWE